MIYFTSATPNCDPHVGSAQAAGFDLRVFLGENPRDDMTSINPGETKVIRTGLKFEIPKDWVGLIMPRSSTGKLQVKLENTVGVIDSDYRGEVLLRLYNFGNETQIIYNYDRIVQMVVVPHYPTTMLEKVDELSNTERGEGGFGSTGKN